MRRIKMALGAIVCVALLTGAATQVVRYTGYEAAERRLASFVLVDSGRVLIWQSPTELRLIDLADDQVMLVVSGAGPDPEPDPNPDPDPKPDPDPDPGPVKIFVTVIEESADRSIEHGRVYTSTELADYLTSGSHQWRVVDDDVTNENGETPADLAPYLSRAAGKTLPWMIVADSNGDVLAEQTVPETVESTLAILKKYGGD